MANSDATHPHAAHGAAEGQGVEHRGAEQGGGAWDLAGARPRLGYRVDGGELAAAVEEELRKERPEPGSPEG